MDSEPSATGYSPTLESEAQTQARGFVERMAGGPAEDSFTGGSSQGTKDPPERWGELFARSATGSNSRGVGGKGVKRHPSSAGEDIVIRSGARFSPPARGFAGSRGFQRARSPDDPYPLGENAGRKGRSLVLERGLGDLRSRRAGGSTSGGLGGSKGGEKHAGGDAGALWPLVVGLQEEARSGWQPQQPSLQKPSEGSTVSSHQSPAQPEWSPWFDRPPQLCKSGSESSDSEPPYPDEVCFAPIQRRRLSNNVDSPDAQRVEESVIQGAPFSFGPPGFGHSPTSDPVQNLQTLSPPEAPPPFSDNLFSTAFAFPPPASISERANFEANLMDTDPPPAPAPTVQTPVHPVQPTFDEDDIPMPALLPPSLGTPPPPAPQFIFPHPAPRSHFVNNRRGPAGNLFPQPLSSGSSRGLARTGAQGPPPPWFPHPPVVFDGLAEADQTPTRHRGPVDAFGRPFSEVGMGATFASIEPPASPFMLLPVAGETGEPALNDAPMRPPAQRAPSPVLFDDLDPLRQLRRLSPGESPREGFQGGFDDRIPLAHQNPAATRLARHVSPPGDRSHVAHRWRAPTGRMRDVFDEMDDWEERERVDVDMDGSWWDMEAAGGAPERRARSPPRRTTDPGFPRRPTDPGFTWLGEPLWGGGTDPVDEAGGNNRPNATGRAERRGPVRRRRFSLFDDEGIAARTNAPGQHTLTPDPVVTGGERVAVDDQAARRRGRTWLREVSSSEGGSVRPPGASAADASRSAREGLFMARRGVGPLGSAPPPPPPDAVLGRPPVYRNLRQFLSEAGAPPPPAPHPPSEVDPTADDDAGASAGHGLAGLFRDGSGSHDTEAAIGRARARRHRARLFEGREGGLPPPLLAMLNALEEAEQFQDLTGDQLIRLQIALAGGGMSARRRRELDAMRVDVDRMTYEELLELEERIGNVSVGLSPETVVEKLPITKWQTSAGGASDSEKEVKCVVCQVEYEESEDVRILPCTHCYHADCIKSWLATKNECPVCKAKVVP